VCLNDLTSTPTTLPITLSAIDPENSIKITHFYCSHKKNERTNNDQKHPHGVLGNVIKRQSNRQFLWFYDSTAIPIVVRRWNRGGIVIVNIAITVSILRMQMHSMTCDYRGRAVRSLIASCVVLNYWLYLASVTQTTARHSPMTVSPRTSLPNWTLTAAPRLPVSGCSVHHLPLLLHFQPPPLCWIEIVRKFSV